MAFITGTGDTTDAPDGISATGKVIISGGGTTTDAPDTMPARSPFYFLHRLKSGEQSQAQLFHRISAGLQTQAYLLHRISDSRFQKLLLHRVAVGTHSPFNLLHRINAMPPEVATQSSNFSGGTPISGMPGYVAAPEYEMAWKTGYTADGSNSYQFLVLTPSATYNLGEAPYYLQVTHNESGPCQWQIGVVDQNGDYHPRKQGGAFQNVMTNHRYDQNDDVVKKFVANIVYGGAQYDFVGYPTKFADTRSKTNPIDFTWGGVDASDRFFRKAQTAKTLRSVGNSLLTNVDLLTDACMQLKTQYDFSRVRTENIRVQHRQDARWGDLVQQAFDVAQSRWQVQGEQIVGYQSLYTGPATWTYDKATIILESSLTSDSPKICNQATARRGNEGGKSQGAVVVCLAFGTYRASFSPGVTSLKMTNTPSPFAVATDAICRNAQGGIVTILKARNLIFTGLDALQVSAPGPITSVEFTWGVTIPGLTLTSAPGLVTFAGATNDPNGGSDPTYTVTMYAPDSINGLDGQPGWGLQPEELKPNPLFYDSKVEQRYLVDWLTEHAFDLLPASYRVFLNHQMRPGDRVAIVDYVLGLTEVRYVKQCTHSFSDDPRERFTRMSTVLYPESVSLMVGKYPNGVAYAG